jgi:hypothetical protein
VWDRNAVKRARAVATIALKTIPEAEQDEPSVP